MNRNPITGPNYLSPSLLQSVSRCRNINLLSIAYAFQPRLRSRLTQGGRTFPWKPWTFDGQDSHLTYRYLYRHTHFQALHRSSRSGFVALGTLTYRSSCDDPAVSVSCLAPVHFRRGPTRLVSCYALFKGWLLLSQPPSCLGGPTSFPT